ncbi:Protein yop1 [Diplonema papillatum]|nr:Protein yop1 [Diplonema papillatum]|eukprot:gene21017-32385_t
MGLLTGLMYQYPTEFLCKAWMLVCGYQSYKAIESTDTADDTQWLTFWTIISVVQFAEFWSDLFRRYLPYYNEAKLALLFWLGAMRGANLVYTKLRPLLVKHQDTIDGIAGKHLKQMNK